MQRTGNNRQLLLIKLIVGFHIAADNLEQVIERSRYPVAFQHIGQFADGRLEVSKSIARLPVEGYLAENDQQISQFFLVQNRYVAVDDSFPFEPFDSFMNGRFREVDLLSDLLNGQSGIMLQQSQDSAIGFI